jgi:antitoxin MazE
MELQINRWGNSLAMRLPAALAKDLGLQEGSSLSPEELGKRLLAVSSEVSQSQLQARQKLIAQIRKMHKTMPITRPLTKDEMSRY